MAYSSLVESTCTLAHDLKHALWYIMHLLESNVGLTIGVVVIIVLKQVVTLKLMQVIIIATMALSISWGSPKVVLLSSSTRLSVVNRLEDIGMIPDLVILS